MSERAELVAELWQRIIRYQTAGDSAVRISFEVAHAILSFFREEPDGLNAFEAGWLAAMGDNDPDVILSEYCGWMEDRTLTPDSEPSP